MRIATTTGDFKAYCENYAEIIRAFEGTGFKHIDYSFYRLNYPGSPFMGNDWVKEVAAAAKEAEKLGLDFVQAHSPRNDFFSDDPETVIKGNIRAIEACAYLGIDRIVVHSGRSEKFQVPDNMAAYREAVKGFYEALYPAMEKYNVRVLAENYTPSYKNECSFFSGEDLASFIDMCDNPMLGVCWDVGHGNLLNPTDQYEDLTTLGNRLCAVHIQDNFGTNDNHLCPYMGNLDIDAVMRGLKDSGFIDRNGVFTFECDNIVSPANSKGEYKSNPVIPSFRVKKAAITLMYEIGCDILTKYGCSVE
ncbi:MAG: sugar phosphate isomerase/epimerase [bacterium]|nr:sugar phosphate isomerase/epimerase [bacterium]